MSTQAKPVSKTNPKDPSSATSVAGKDLMPDLSASSSVAVREVWFWVGVFPDCPTEGIDLAGINFPKQNEKLVADPMRPGKKKRIPVVGALVPIRRDKIDLMQKKLSRTVVRFTDKLGTAITAGDHPDLSAISTTRRKGHIVTIPSREEIEQRRKIGRPTHEYVAREDDAPAAMFMFALPCDDQGSPQRGDHYPDSLAKTGLLWPKRNDED